MKKGFLILTLLFLPTIAAAQLNTFQGGTGSTSPSGILVGDSTIRLKSLIVGSGLTFNGTTLTATGGAGTPGGLNTQVQYNNAGSFGGISGATTNGTILSLTNALLGGATLTTSVVNGVTLTTGGSATTFLNGAGSYSTPAGGGSFPFTPTTNYNAVANATNTPIWFQAGLQASSTSYIGSTTFDGVSGNVSIGTPTVSSLFTVSKQGTIQAPISGSIAQFVGQDANPLRLTFDTHNNANTSGTAFMFRRSRGTSATPLADALDDVLGSLNFRGYGTTGYSAGSTALMTAKAEGTFTDASMPTAITFDTTPINSVTAQERVRIDNMGDFGIGTTSPFARLSVHAASNGFSNPILFALASSSLTATSTVLSVAVTGSTTAQIASSTNGWEWLNSGTSTPALQIHQANDAAAGLAGGNGLAITTSRTGSTGVFLQLVSQAVGDTITLAGKGNTAGQFQINTNGMSFIQSSNAVFTLTTSNATFSPLQRTATTPNLQYTLSNCVACTANVESPSVLFTNVSTSVVIHSNGTIPVQRQVLINPVREGNTTFAAANSITRAATVGIASPPFTNLNGNVLIGNAIGLLIGSSTAATLYTATTTNAIGMEIDATGFGGATNTYAASTTGRWIMNGINVAAGTISAVCRVNATGEMVVNSGSLDCNPSDEEKKTPLEGLTVSALDLVNKLKPSAYYFKQDLKDGYDHEHYGFGAQSAQAVDEHFASSFDAQGIARSIDLTAIVAVNTKAIQELDAKVNTLTRVARTAEENWQWLAILLLLAWNIYLTARRHAA